MGVFFLLLFCFVLSPPTLVELVAAKGQSSAGWESAPVQVNMDMWGFPGIVNMCVNA